MDLPIVENAFGCKYISFCIQIKLLGQIDRKFHAHGENVAFVLYEYVIHSSDETR